MLSIFQPFVYLQHFCNFAQAKTLNSLMDGIDMVERQTLSTKLFKCPALKTLQE